MSKELFESLDKEIFKPELVESLKAEFAKTVNEEVESKLLILQVEEKDKLLTENEAYLAKEKERLLEEADSFVTLQVEETAVKLNDYLDLVVEELIKENELGLTSEVERKKVSAMIEAFSGFIVTAGVDVATINEAKETGDSETKLSEITEKFNELVEENLEIKQKNKTFLQMGVVNELKEGLSIIESEKFVRLSSLIEFSESVEYSEKLQTLKESIKGVVAEDPTKKEVLEESEKTSCAYSHLL